MPMMRGFAKVTEDGKIPLPGHIAREAKLKPGQLVEMKLTGPTAARYLIVHKRDKAR